MSDLRDILPLAIDWAEQHAAIIMREGCALTAAERVVAEMVGVSHPERVRLVLCPRLPVPEHPALFAACTAAGFFSPDMVGLTLEHGIYIQQGHCTGRLLSHELRHVHQYEQAGSIASFLQVYIPQLLQCGYMAAPLEIDARLHEVHFSGVR